LKKYCFERVARKWEIRTWSHRGAKKQLCKDRLFEKVLFLKGGRKVGNEDLEAPGAQKQPCKDRLFKKSVVLEGWPENGKSGPGATWGLRSNRVRTNSFKKCCF